MVRSCEAAKQIWVSQQALPTGNQDLAHLRRRMLRWWQQLMPSWPDAWRSVWPPLALEHRISPQAAWILRTKGAVRNLLSRPMEPRSIGCAPGPVLNGSHHRAEASRGDRIQWLGHGLFCVLLNAWSFNHDQDMSHVGGASMFGFAGWGWVNVERRGLLCFKQGGIRRVCRLVATAPC